MWHLVHAIGEFMITEAIVATVEKMLVPMIESELAKALPILLKDIEALIDKKLGIAPAAAAQADVTAAKDTTPTPPTEA